MKLIHWSPTQNKNSILDKGIQIQDTWISASILTPFKNLNRWWLDFLLHDQEYFGFIFEVQPEDFPLVHNTWACSGETETDDNFEVISTTRYDLNKILASNPKGVFANEEMLKKSYKEDIIWRIAESTKKDMTYEESVKEMLEFGQNYIKKHPKKAARDFFDNPNFMEFVFEDYEVLLFKDIAPERIEKVIKPNTHYPYHDLLNEIKASF
jgi:hypothetical protein